jgi:hypothetical protein
MLSSSPVGARMSHLVAALGLGAIPGTALARRASASEINSALMWIGIAVVIFLGGWVYFFFKSKTTVTRPDGSTSVQGQDTDGEHAPEEGSAPRKVQLGRSTMTFGLIEDRSDWVNAATQKYGDAFRIVHEGTTGIGHSEEYVLIVEVPAKCPSCKESFIVEDFGSVDCPGCSSALLVYFNETLQRTAVEIVDGGVESNAERGPGLEQQGSVERRFGKIG